MDSFFCLYSLMCALVFLALGGCIVSHSWYLGTTWHSFRPIYKAQGEQCYKVNFYSHNFLIITQWFTVYVVDIGRVYTGIRVMVVHRIPGLCRHFPYLIRWRTEAVSRLDGNLWGKGHRGAWQMVIPCLVDCISICVGGFVVDSIMFDGTNSAVCSSILPSKWQRNGTQCAAGAFGVCQAMDLAIHYCFSAHMMEQKNGIGVAGVNWVLCSHF